jgi:hypothetical protein
LREETNLISYPYYTKYTKAKNSTYFQHINLNISEAAYTRQGVELIQESVSFNNEDEDNYTEMLQGFHNHIKEYQA